MTRFLNIPSLRCALAVALVASSGSAAAEPKAAPAPVSTMEMLAALPLQIGNGRGRVDGQDLAVRVVTGAATISEMLEALRTTFAGKRTLTLMPDAHVSGVMIADVRSPQCPACTRPTGANLRALMDDSVVLTFVDAPGAGLIGIASNASRMVGRMTKEPLAYEGSRLAPISGVWSTLSQSRFEASGTTVSSAVVRARHGEALAALIGAELEGRGFKRLGADANQGEGSLGAKAAAVRAWQKDNAVVSIDPANDDEVVINEVEVQ